MFSLYQPEQMYFNGIEAMDVESRVVEHADGSVERFITFKLATPTVTVDRARFERLLEVARAWVTEGASNGEGWDAAFMRANLQPGDLDPIS